MHRSKISKDNTQQQLAAALVSQRFALWVNGQQTSAPLIQLQNTAAKKYLDTSATFWPLYVADVLMALKSAGRLLKEQISERQVPLPAAAQAFHFSNRTWKHVARWWNRVERETLGQGWFKYHFYLLDFRFILCKKKQMTECKYSCPRKVFWPLRSVSFKYRLKKSLSAEW